MASLVFVTLNSIHSSYFMNITLGIKCRPRHSRIYFWFCPHPKVHIMILLRCLLSSDNIPTADYYAQDNLLDFQKVSLEFRDFTHSFHLWGVLQGGEMVGEGGEGQWGVAKVKWKGCIVFPEDTEQTGWGHQDRSLCSSGDDGAPHWITVDSASSSTSQLPLQPFPLAVRHTFSLFHHLHPTHAPYMH